MSIDKYPTLYRKDANGKISYWRISFTGKLKDSITIVHGKLNGTSIHETINTNRTIEAEIKTRYNAKLKQGYISLEDLKDNTNLPVNEELEQYLLTYLPDNRSTADGALLPMLAKVFDNINNKIFKDGIVYGGQCKINGLRCFIRCIQSNDNLFGFIKFTFQSREGTFWNSLDNLSNYILQVLPSDFIKEMINNEWILDGELYIPGFTLNDINSAVKNVLNPYNKFVQFWCYDIYMPDTQQHTRLYMLNKYLGNYTVNINNKEDHLNNKELFNIVLTLDIDNEDSAIIARDKYIDLGFEGLIMRNPYLEYEAGKRKMIKYKRATDGIFKIMDIIPDGIKRPDVGKIVCKNDINDAAFECHLSASIEHQKLILKNKCLYIGKNLFIEYGERSGVEQVPFHIKTVKFI